MAAQSRGIQVWFVVVVVLVGLLLAGAPGRVWADDPEPDKAAATEKAVDPFAEKTDEAAAEPKAEPPAAERKTTEAATDKAAEKPGQEKPAESAKKPAPDKSEKKKGSFLSRLLRDKAVKKATKGSVMIKVKVETSTPVVEKSEKQDQSAAKTPTVVRLKLSGSYPEAPETPSPFSTQSRSLNGLLTKFQELSEDEDVAAVVLEIETSGLGGGKINEIREAIGRLRASGKPVYAFLTSVDGGRYLLACACDEVLMLPSGIMMIPGVRAETTFYKGLLDKIGVEFQVLQMGKYKGAGEPYSRAKMSPPLRESIEAVIDDRYEWFVRSVAHDRDLEDYQVKSLIDRAFFMAPAAKRAGLVDRVVYLDAFLEQLPEMLNVDKVKVVSAYKSRRNEVDLSGIGGMMKLVQLMLGGEDGKIKKAGKKIAVVHAVGPIVEGKSYESLFGGRALGSTTLVEALKKADQDSDVVAIVLRIDSPGGSGVASDLIWRETVRIKKPIIASMGDVAGSGGYYIAMGADKIFAEPQTITGSIGVIGGKMVLGGLYKKIGLTTEVIARGKNSGVMSSTEPFTPEGREAMMSVFRQFYRQFVSKAAKGRDMTYEELHELAQGRIYSGEDAVELGLIDELGTLHDAVAEAKKAAGLDKSEKVDLLILPRPKTFFEQLFEDPSASTDAAAVSLAGSLAGPLAESLLGELTVIERLAREPVLLWMPYRIEVR